MARSATVFTTTRAMFSTSTRAPPTPVPVPAHPSVNALISDVRTHVLRLVLEASSQTHANLKNIVLGSLAVDLKASRLKGVFDVALVSLLEEGLLERAGSGNWARYQVPLSAYFKAQTVAYCGWVGDDCDIREVMREGGTKRDLSLSPLRVSGGRGMKKRKRRSFCAVPMSP